MSIKFVCSCGKHLRARDEMAARRSMCPACGAPVGIPSLQPTHRGTTAAPMTPMERLRHRRANASADPATADPPSPADTPSSPVSLSDDTVVKRHSGPPADAVRKRSRRRGWAYEAHWAECLLFPLRALPLICALALALTLLSALAVKLLPQLAELETQSVWTWLGLAPFLVLPLTVVGYACGLLDCTLASAAAGEAGFVRWPGRDVGLAMKSSLTWLICFLAGPVVPAAAAPVYWLNCGEPDRLDWVILAELAVVAVAWWLLALLSVCQGNRLRDVHPLRVAALAHRLGPRTPVVAAAAGALVLVHGWFGLAALEKVHFAPAEGVAQLALCWFGLLAGAAFLFRLLGVWYYRTRPGESAGAASGAAS
jgi:hypothetical protein